MSSVHAPITLGSCIRLFDVSIVVSRSRAPYTEKGRKVDTPTPETFEIVASVQPMTQAEMQSLPEGLRNSGAVKVYTPTELRTVSVNTKELADDFEYRGVRYRVHAVDGDWSDLAGYFKYIATRSDR